MTFAFHVENRFASGKAKRPRGPRSSLAIPRCSPQIDLQTRALGYYLQCHIQALPDVPSAAGEGTLSGSVAAWDRSGKTCEMVDLALSSLALAVFSRTHHHSQAAVEAASRYSRLLHMARARMAQVGNPDPSRNYDFEACLVAVSLMARYESSVYCRSSTSPPSFSHYDGATAILKLWHDSLGSARPTTSIIRNTRRGLIKIFMLRRLPLPEWMLDGAQFGEAGNDLERDRLIARLVKLNAAVSAPFPHQAYHDHDVNNLQTIEDLETEARSLDQVLETRAANFPPEWSYQSTKAPPDPHARNTYYSPTTQYTFSSPSHAAIWSQYFAYRLLLSTIHLSLLELRPRPDPFIGSPHYHAQVEHAIQSQRMADSLAASLPSCWGNPEVAPTITNTTAISGIKQGTTSPSQASLAIWPLSIACNIAEPMVDSKQQRWFRERLAWLGKVTGAGILEQHASAGL